jgi:hypothetical protein
MDLQMLACDASDCLFLLSIMHARLADRHHLVAAGAGAGHHQAHWNIGTLSWTKKKIKRDIEYTTPLPLVRGIRGGRARQHDGRARRVGGSRYPLAPTPDTRALDLDPAVNAPVLEFGGDGQAGSGAATLCRRGDL